MKRTHKKKSSTNPHDIRSCLITFRGKLRDRSSPPFTLCTTNSRVELSDCDTRSTFTCGKNHKNSNRATPCRRLNVTIPENSNKGS